jgi:predicted DNA-binding protein
MARKPAKEINIRVSDDLHQRLAALSMESGNSITSFVRKFIRAGLANLKGVGKTLTRSEGKQKIRSKEKIGETFVRLGKMKKEDVKKILRVQRDKYSFSRRFGEIALEMGMLDQKTLDDYLDGNNLNSRRKSENDQPSKEE